MKYCLKTKNDKNFLNEVSVFNPLYSSDKCSSKRYAFTDIIQNAKVFDDVESISLAKKRYYDDIGLELKIKEFISD
jgi:hypothetical protein